MTVALSFEDCPVVELRRYTLHPGGLPALVSVFDRHLVEPQEEAGMTVGGTFADDDDPASFTWLRGFPDHGSRVRALGAFYGGPVWSRYGGEAGATMVDSDDVLLLRPTAPPHRAAAAVPRGAASGGPRPERVLLGAHGLGADAEAVQSWFAASGCPALADVLGVRVAAWRTDPTPNGFPRLPVRDEQALVWLAVFPAAADSDEAASRLVGSEVGRELDAESTWRRILRLRPTPRSAHPAAGPVPARGATRAVRPVAG